jgi:transcriptional regulator with XRE-family HTH domain
MSLQSKEGLHKRLANKKYRDAFVASRIAQTIAFQARLLRQRKDLSQAELAKELGTSQNAISRLENPQYGKPSISTLRKIASFFNVGLVVRFAPLSEIADWSSNLSERSVNVPDFDHDMGFLERKPVAAVHDATGGPGELITEAAGAITRTQVANTETASVVIRPDNVFTLQRLQP